MNKILIRREWFLSKCQQSITPNILPNKFFSKDVDKQNNYSTEEDLKKPGPLHDKTQSIQEESFFHKESQEQLQKLKKKVKKEEEEKKNKK